MRENLLVINACIRKNDSRTLSLASAMLDRLGERYTMHEIDLTDMPLGPLSGAAFARRCAGEYDPLALDWARRFAAADRIVVLAPFWDMSFPSALKVFCEQISLNGITFADTPDGSTKGICAAKKMLLITTRGMEIADGGPLEQATPYLRALCWLWGIPEFTVVSAIGMDMCDEATCASRLQAAQEKGLALCEDF